MEIKKLSERAKNNKSHRAYWQDANENFRLELKYSPHRKGKNVLSEFDVQNAYFVSVNGELIAGLYEINNSAKYILQVDSVHKNIEIEASTKVNDIDEMLNEI